MTRKKKFGLLAVFIALSAGKICAGGDEIRLSLSVKDSQERTENRVETVRQDAAGTDITTTTKTETEICTLEVTIRSRCDTATNVQMEWYFLSEKVESEELVARYAGKKEILLPAGAAVVNETIVSQPMEYKIVSKDPSELDDKHSGDLYEGYVLLITRGGEILAEDSNSTRYLKDRRINKFRKNKELL